MHTRHSSRVTVAEQSLITTDAAMGNDATVVSERAFELLRQQALDPDSDWLTLFTRKGREYVRIGPYVGLVQLADGTQLELLPKLEQPDQARPLLLTMLSHLPDSPFRTLPMSQTGAADLPLWDVFVLTFLNILATLTRQGLQRAYETVERNEPVWKGKFQAGRHLRDNAHHAERLAVRYDQLSADIAPNRLLKSTLVTIDRQLPRSPVQAQVRQWLCTLDDVPPSASVSDDLRASRRLGRLFTRYEPALRWAEALLMGQAFGAQSGRTNSLSLLFPMPRVFEAYVAHGVRRYWPESGLVTVQESSAHLVDDHIGGPKFKLRPDILIRQADGQTLVLDTKWKLLDGTDRRGNYGIEQADLYQLFAYGKKYDATRLFLIYPMNPAFQEPLHVFGYDASTSLHVLPFDLSRPLAAEVDKLVQYALSV